MVWANGFILGIGGLLITIPIILHLLMQPKPKRLIFPALRFLQERQHRSRSRMQLRHFLLLLLRCLLIAMLVLALAGPTVGSREFGNWLTLAGIGFSGLMVALVLIATWLRGNRNWLLLTALVVLLIGHLGYGGWIANKLRNAETVELIGGAQEPVAALIVVDASPRMEYRNENRIRLDVAKEQASWLIRQFPPDSQVCVLTNDGDSPFFSVDVSAAMRRVETLETNYVESPLPSALLDGLEFLEKAPEERKEIYVITDLTKAGWQGDKVRPLLRRLEANPEISLFVLDVGVEQPQNFSLGDLRISGASISENGRFMIDTQINRLGPAAQRTIRMTLEQPDDSRPVIRDGVTLFPDQVLEEQTQAVDLRDNGSKAVNFVNSTKLARGTYHGRIEIEGQDSLTLDDVRYFTIRVQAPWQVLVVHPSNVSPRNLVSTIAPAAAVQTRLSNYDCEVVTQNEFLELDSLSKYSAIFLLDPEPLDDPTWIKLRGYVSRGGGLAIVLGHNAGERGFADAGFQTDVAMELLTGRLDVVWDAADEGWTMRPQDISHPFFKLLRPYEEGVLWNRVPIYLHWGLEPDEQADTRPTQVLMRFTNGEPALIERQIDQGRVLVMLTPISERAREEGRRVWNELYNFVSTFAPWLLNQMMTEYLVQQDADSLNLNVGQVATLNNDLSEYPESYQVFSPRSGKPATALNANNFVIRHRFTNDPGHYRIKGNFDSRPLLRGFSANLPSAATDLTRLLPAELDEVLGAGRYQIAKNNDEIQRQQGTSRKGQEFYPLLVLMMLIFFAVEYLMSNRFYASR
jgi:hypothetical protein